MSAYGGPSASPHDKDANKTNEKYLYDSESDSELPMVPLPGSEDDSLLGRLQPGAYNDSLIMSKATFDEDDEVNSDFEILPDDEDDDLGAVDQSLPLEKVEALESEREKEDGDGTKVRLSPKQSPQLSPRQSPEDRDDSALPSLSHSTDRALFKLAETPTSPQQQLSPKPEERQKRFHLPPSMEKAMRLYKSKAETKDNDTWLHGAHEEADGFSSDDYSDHGHASIDDDSQIFEDDADQLVDFSTLSSLPNSFLSPPPDTYDYLDPELVKSIEQQDISVFAWEHHLLTKGLMQLLAERDHIGVEGDIHDNSNVLKMGPLKKRYAQKLWSVKYVEIRKGNLTYYDDKAMKEGKNRRTIIHLRKRTCKCEALAKMKDNFVFALFDEGGPKRVWMAKSEEARDGWIRAINQAMIGETDDSLDFPLNMTLYKKAIEEYTSVRKFLEDAKTLKDYFRVASTLLLYRQNTSSALRVPMKWIRDEILPERKDVSEKREEEKKRDTPHERVKSTVSNFWNNFCNTSIVLNGYLIEGDSAYSRERAIGSLSRCILEFDKVDTQVSNVGSLKLVKRGDVNNFLTESEAVTHARSILTGILRSKTRNESLTTVEKLISNESVVSSIEVKKTEPPNIDVSFAGDDFSGQYEPEPNDLSGWIPSRHKKKSTWKDKFFVLSEGVLSFYLEAYPRPFGLRGQFVLKDSKVEAFDRGLEGSILEIEGKDHYRQLLFQDRAEFVRWKAIIERTCDANIERLSPTHDIEEMGTLELKKRTPRGPKSFQKLQKEAKDSRERAYRVMKEAKDAGMNSIKKSSDKMKDASEKIARKFQKRHRPARRRPTTDMLLTSTRALQLVSEKREPTVQVVVELNNVIEVMTKSKDNDLNQDVMM
jgi:hypothetical protein